MSKNRGRPGFLAPGDGSITDDWDESQLRGNGKEEKNPKTGGAEARRKQRSQIRNAVSSWLPLTCDMNRGGLCGWIRGKKAGDYSFAWLLNLL